MSSAVHQAREALGARLREIRKDARLTGLALARLIGWHSSKISRIEHGTQSPSEDDIRAWCRHCQAEDQVTDLIATLRNLETMYLEWRRQLRTGTRARQEAPRRLDAQTRLFRIHSPLVVSGILQTADYAAHLLSRAIEFYQIPDDLEEGVAARMERQQILYHGDHRFHVLLGEQTLTGQGIAPDVMANQLDRLLAVQHLPRLRLGIITRTGDHRLWPVHPFWIYDDRMVRVETISAELTVTQPREIALYAKAFQWLTGAAVYGREARDLIAAALRDVTGE